MNTDKENRRRKNQSICVHLSNQWLKNHLSRIQPTPLKSLRVPGNGMRIEEIFCFNRRDEEVGEKYWRKE
jgi:hypothetical protein